MQDLGFALIRSDPARQAVPSSTKVDVKKREELFMAALCSLEGSIAVTRGN